MVRAWKDQGPEHRRLRAAGAAEQLNQPAVACMQQACAQAMSGGAAIAYAHVHAGWRRQRRGDGIAGAHVHVQVEGADSANVQADVASDVQAGAGKT